MFYLYLHHPIYTTLLMARSKRRFLGGVLRDTKVHNRMYHKLSLLISDCKIRFYKVIHYKLSVYILKEDRNVYYDISLITTSIKEYPVIL